MSGTAAVENILSLLAGAVEGFGVKSQKKAERGASIKTYLQNTEIPRLRKELEGLGTDDAEARQRLETLIDTYQKFLTLPDEKVPDEFATLKLPTGTRVNDLATIFDMTKTFKEGETPTEAESAALAQAQSTQRKLSLAMSFLPDLTSIASTGRDTKGKQYDEQTRQHAIEMLQKIESGQFDINDVGQLNPIVGFDLDEFVSLTPQEQARRIIDAGWGKINEEGQLELSADAPVGLANAIKSGAIVPDFVTQKFNRLAQTESFKKLQLENSKLAAQIENLASATEVNQANVDRILAEVDRLQTLTPLEKDQLKAQIANIQSSTKVLEAQVEQVQATTTGIELKNERDRRTLESTIAKDNYLNQLAIKLGDEQLKQARATTLSVEAQAELAGLQVELEKATFNSTVEERAARALSAKIDAYMKDALSPFSLAQAAVNAAIDLPPSVIAKLPDELLKKVGVTREALDEASRLGAAVRGSQAARSVWGTLDQAMQSAPPKQDREFTKRALDEQLKALGITDPNVRKGMIALVEGAWEGIDSEASNAYLKTLAYVKSLEAQRAQSDATTPGLGIKDVNTLLNSLIDNEAARVGKMRDYLVAQGCASYISDLAVRYYPDRTPQSPEKPGQTCGDLISGYRDATTSWQMLVNLQKSLVLPMFGVPTPTPSPSNAQGGDSTPKEAPPVRPQGGSTTGVESFDAAVAKIQDPSRRLVAVGIAKRIREWSASVGPDDPVPTWVNDAILALANSTGLPPHEVARLVLEGK